MKFFSVGYPSQNIARPAHILVHDSQMVINSSLRKRRGKECLELITTPDDRPDKVQRTSHTVDSFTSPTSSTPEIAISGYTEQYELWKGSHGCLESTRFTPEEYWITYKAIYRAACYNVQSAKEMIMCSKLFPLLSTYSDDDGQLPWDSRHFKYYLLHDTLLVMRSYIWKHYGWNWTRLSVLIDAFEENKHQLRNDYKTGGWQIFEESITQTEKELEYYEHIENDDLDFIPRRLSFH